MTIPLCLICNEPIRFGDYNGKSLFDFPKINYDNNETTGGITCFECYDSYQFSLDMKAFILDAEERLNQNLKLKDNISEGTLIKSGISQIGGKFRLRKQLLKLTPYHEFFLSLFCGACHYELNKPRCRYECFNDKDAEIINYLIMIERYPREFDDYKKGVFGLVSQEICNRMINGALKPRNNLERAYFFYYLNKLTFAGVPEKGIWGISNPRAGLPTLHDKDFETIKSKFRGIILPTVCKEKSVNDAKLSCRGIAPKASFKGVNPKTTRPFTNNDCGLLTPLDPNAIKRLRYVNLTCYDFVKVYKLFYEAFHIRKELTKECFVYEDPPFPGTEKYYQNKFTEKDHYDLIEINLKAPFNIMLSIGGDCDFYLDAHKEAGWYIHPVYTKYSTDANTQKPSKEYIITNYDIRKVPKMVMDYQPTLINFIKG